MASLTQIEVNERRDEIDVGENEREDGVRDMVVEDTADIALLGVLWRDKERPAEALGKDGEGGEEPKGAEDHGETRWRGLCAGWHGCSLALLQGGWWSAVWMRL